MEPSLQRTKLKVDASLDIRALESADGYHRAVAQLRDMPEDAVLELYLDEGEPLSNIPFGLRAEGHELLVSEPVKQGVRLLIRKRTLLT